MKTITRRVSTHSGMLEFCPFSMFHVHVCVTSSFLSLHNWVKKLDVLWVHSYHGISGMQLPLVALRLIGSTMLALCPMRTCMLSGSSTQLLLCTHPISSLHMCTAKSAICCRHWCACGRETRETWTTCITTLACKFSSLHLMFC